MDGEDAPGVDAFTRRHAPAVLDDAAAQAVARGLPLAQALLKPRNIFCQPCFAPSKACAFVSARQTFGGGWGRSSSIVIAWFCSFVFIPTPRAMLSVDRRVRTRTPGSARSN